MKNKRLAGLLPLSLALASAAFGQAGAVKILAPADGARLDALEQNRIAYEVVPGTRGDHVHLYVDGREAAILRQLKGNHTLDTLAPGSRELCVKVVNKAHVPIGVEQCVKVKVE
ncbi:MAG: hypothetical protein HYY97_02315 [Rhodocyclales bacterium]|nr:hypothetical protein [Rhodocyclales bacterium]